VWLRSPDMRHASCGSVAPWLPSDRVTILVNDMLRDHPQAAREALEGTRTVKEALERSGIFADEGMTHAFVTETRGVVDRLTGEQNHLILDTVRDAASTPGSRWT